MSEENKALVRRWFAELDKGNEHIVDDLVAVDYIDHNPPLPDMAPGREGVKQANALLRVAFPDARHTIEDQIAEGEKVVTRITARATFQGDILGIPPTWLAAPGGANGGWQPNSRPTPGCTGARVVAPG